MKLSFQNEILIKVTHMEISTVLVITFGIDLHTADRTFCCDKIISGVCLSFRGRENNYLPYKCRNCQCRNLYHFRDRLFCMPGCWPFQHVWCEGLGRIVQWRVFVEDVLDDWFLSLFLPSFIIIIIIITAIELSPSGSSPYTSTDKTNKNNIYIEETIPKHSTNDTKRSKYKYTYYQNSHTIVIVPTHYKTS